MSNSRVPGDGPFEFSLPDASADGDPLSAAALAAEHEAVAVVLLRSHYSPFCRGILRSLRDAYEAFTDRSVGVVPVVPAGVDEGALVHDRYNLPFPVLCDPSDGEDEEPRFDTFELYEHFLQNLPAAVLFDADGEELTLATTLSGDGPQDFPDTEVLLDAIDEHTVAGDPVETGQRIDS